MATIQCDKVTINIEKSKELELLEELQRFGKMELIQQARKSTHHVNLDEIKDHLEKEISLLDEANVVLSGFRQKKSLLQNLEDERLQVKESEIAQIEKSKDKVLMKAQEIIDKHKRVEEAHIEMKNLEQLIIRIEPYKDLDAPIFESYSFLSFKAFVIAAADRQFIERELKKFSSEFEIFLLWENEERASMIIAGPKDMESDVEKIISSRGKIFSPDMNLSGNVNTILKESALSIKRLQAEAEKLLRELSESSDERSKLLVLREILGWDMQKIQIQDAFTESYSGHSKLEGWIDRRDLSELTKIAKKIHADATVDVEEDVPVSERKVTLRNRGLTKSFQGVTTTMGYPDPKQIDPSPLVTPFFILFFGLCLSDAGYGAVLSIITGFILLMTKRLKPNLKDIVTIIFFCGLSTILFGALEGSWFGFVPDSYVMAANANGFLVFINPFINLLKWAMVIDPVSSISLMLGLMMGLGIVHLFIAYFTAFVAKAKHGEWVSGILEDLVSGLLLLALGVYGLSFVIESLNYLTLPLQWVSIGLYLLMVIGQGKSAGWLFLIPVGILKSFMIVVGYLSETLSYTRLLPLGISTGIIAGVVNLLAFLTSGVPYVGPVIVTIVLLGGHTMNILLNLLSAYITSNRLHFVEFFPKMMSGAGKPFMPFKRAEEYVVITS